MLEIAICDDEKFVAANIEKMLMDLSASSSILLEIDVFFDGSTLVDYIKSGKCYDIIYLDIEMAVKNGVDAAREIRMFDNSVLIIYVTSHESFAKEVFEVSTFRFITKPIEKDIFKKYFMDAVNKLIVQPKYFQYRYNKITYRLPINEIMYFQSDKRITYIITLNGSKKCYGKLNDIEKKLNASDIFFYRPHQTFLVNPKYVSMYMYDSMELIDGTTFTVSENRRKSVNKLFCMLKGEDIVV
ncbi:MAG: LytTR family DNA-binding domain-containing protein [Lachnospiraceae bacterium]|nr:LytTR family DNA-binding domain-containing protein [Lachnospiraceae bacterium]